MWRFDKKMKKSVGYIQYTPCYRKTERSLLYKYISFLFILLCSKNRFSIIFFTGKNERKFLLIEQKRQLPHNKQIMHYIILYYIIYSTEFMLYI